MSIHSPVRRRALAATSIALLALLLTACLPAAPQDVLNALNADRRANSLRALPDHSALDDKAQAWAEKLARDGRLSHSNLSHGAPSCWRSLGENVGYGSSIEAVERAYMSSSPHRANILASKWDYVGVSAAQSGGRWYTVQVFMQGCT